MGVHSLVATLFHVGWGVYMIAETSRLGSQSPAACDYDDDFEELESRCNGYGAAAAFAMFAAVSAFVAAALAKRGPLSWYGFVGSLTLYTIAKISEAGGESEFNCDKDIDKALDTKELCDGYTSAAVFYFFALAAAIAVLLLMWKMAETRHFAISAFFVYLALFTIGFMSEVGGAAANVCNQVGEDDAGDDDVDSTMCNGLGFSTFVLALAMVAAAAFAALAFVKKDTGSMLWLGGSLFLALFFLAWTSVDGTNANVDCDVEDADDDATDASCSGYGAGTFFVLLATIAAIAAVFFSHRNHDQLKQAAFLAGFSLFYLGYCSVYGGISAFYCTRVKEDDDAADDDNYFSQNEKNTCGGFGAAAFFGFAAFAILAAAAVLTHTALGAPTAEEGAQADPSAPQQEKDVPVATAVPVAAEEAQHKDGANV